MKRGSSRLALALGFVALVRSATGSTAAEPASTPETVMSQKAPVAEPRLLKPLQPRYPPHLFRKGISGYVLVQFRLNDEGMPQDARVVMADPQGAFDSAVLQSVAKLRFEVPQEWVAAHPNRLLDFGYVFVIERCVDGDLFPGMTTVIVSAWRSREAGEKCHSPAHNEQPR